VEDADVPDHAPTPDVPALLAVVFVAPLVEVPAGPAVLLLLEVVVAAAELEATVTVLELPPLPLAALMAPEAPVTE
jgi:hypothetical protein